MSIRILTVVAIFSLLPLVNSHAQVNDLTEGIEALNRKIDSSSKSMDELNENIDRMLEEQNAEQLEKTLEQNQRNLEQFMAERKAKEKADTKRLWIRGAGLVILLVFLFFNRMRRKKAS